MKGETMRAKGTSSTGVRRISVRLSDKEYADVYAAAALANKGVAAWLHDAMLRRLPRRDPAEARMIALASDIGGSLRQLIERVDRGAILDDGQIAAVLEEVRRWIATRRES